jgi:hypothetical protein
VASQTIIFLNQMDCIYFVWAVAHDIIGPSDDRYTVVWPCYRGKPNMTWLLYKSGTVRTSFLVGNIYTRHPRCTYNIWPSLWSSNSHITRLLRGVSCVLSCCLCWHSRVYMNAASSNVFGFDVALGVVCKKKHICSHKSYTCESCTNKCAI